MRLSAPANLNLFNAASPAPGIVTFNFLNTLRSPVMNSGYTEAGTSDAPAANAEARIPLGFPAAGR